MKIIRYDDILSVEEAVENDEPLFAVILFDGSEAIVSHADEAVEHYILLQKAGISGVNIDKYFRIVFDKDGADWTFICPPDYKIENFYKDGMRVIAEFLAEMKYFIDIKIPSRYKKLRGEN